MWCMDSHTMSMIGFKCKAENQSDPNAKSRTNLIQKFKLIDREVNFVFKHIKLFYSIRHGTILTYEHQPHIICLSPITIRSFGVHQLWNPCLKENWWREESKRLHWIPIRTINQLKIMSLGLWYGQIESILLGVPLQWMLPVEILREYVKHHSLFISP